MISYVFLSHHTFAQSSLTTTNTSVIDSISSNNINNINNINNSNNLNTNQFSFNRGRISSLLGFNQTKPIEPLPLESAFKLSATRSGNMVSVNFDIAQGYYLYQNKISIKAWQTQVMPSASPFTIVLPNLPVGELHDDEVFKKKLSIYRQQLLVSPIKIINNNNQNKLVLLVYSQGCADLGICYPPRIQQVSFEANQITAQVIDLTADPVLQINLNQSNNQTKEVIVKNNKDIDIKNNKNDIIKNDIIKDNIIKTNTVPLHTEKQVNLPNQLLNTNTNTNTNININTSTNTNTNINNIKEQIKQDNDIVLNNSIKNNIKNNIKNKENIIDNNFDNNFDNNSTYFVTLLRTQSIWVWALEFIGLGLVLAFTPCVLPMLPIISTMVLGQATGIGKSMGWRHALARSAAYVLGMCLSYTVLGVLAGLAGVGLGAYLQQPWVLIAFAVLMVGLAGAQFGWYALTLPVDWQNRLNQKIATQPQHYLGLIIMGALAALIVSPCITPPLAGILLFISQTQNMVQGALALFCLSLGMGLPLILLALGGAAWLPKAGAWMQQVSDGMGLLLLGVALWTVQSVLPAWAVCVASMVVLSVFAVCCGVLQGHTSVGGGNVGQELRFLPRMIKLVGYAALAWAWAILMGMAMGHYAVLKPLAPLVVSPLSSSQPKIAINNPINNNKPIDKPIETAFETMSASQLSALLHARSQTQISLITPLLKPLIIDVYADWCVACLEFEQLTLSNPDVQQALAGFQRIRLDITANTLADQALLQQWQLFGPPALIFYNTDGQVLHNHRVIGFVSANDLLLHLIKIEKQFKK